MHIEMPARGDRRPWVGKRQSSVTTEELIVATERATTKAKARTGGRGDALGANPVEAQARKKSYVIIGFSHDRPSGLGVP